MVRLDISNPVHINLDLLPNILNRDELLHGICDKFCRLSDNYDLCKSIKTCNHCMVSLKDIIDFIKDLK